MISLLHSVKKVEITFKSHDTDKTITNISITIFLHTDTCNFAKTVL